MANDPFFYLVMFALFAVLVVLSIGIGGFGKGGRFNAKYGNKMMQLRILAQAVAVVLILIFIATRQGGG